MIAKRFTAFFTPDHIKIEFQRVAYTFRSFVLCVVMKRISAYPPRQNCRAIVRVVLVLCFMIWGAFSVRLPAFGQWPTMQLDAFECVGGQIGSTLDLRVLAGTGCETADAFLDAFSASETSLAGGSIADLPFQFRSRPDVAAGFYPIRLKGRFGLSNSRSLWLTKEPWQVVPPVNNSRERSFPVGSGIIYSGRFEPRKEVYFQLNLPARTHWRLDCMTRGIDSQAVVLLDVRGPANEPVSVVTCKGFSDHSIAFEAKQPGRYLVKMSDQLYRGGPDFPYAIQLSQQAYRFDLSAIKPKLPLDPADTKTFSEPSELLAAKIDVRRPTIRHSEQEFSDDSSMPINSDIVVFGSFDNPRDKDAFEVFIQEGKSIAIDVLSKHLGQSTDIKVSVFPPADSADATEGKDEKVISASDVDDQPSIGTADLTLRSSDPCFVFTAKRDGNYRIVLYDQQRSPREIYQAAHSKNYYLQLRDPQPDFDLIAYYAAPASKPEDSTPVAPTLFKNQIGCIEVIAVRRDGFSEPIRVQVDRLPEGLSCKPVVIAAGAHQSSLMIDGTQLDSDHLEKSLRIFGEALPLDSATESGLLDQTDLSSQKTQPQNPRVAYAAEITHGPIPTRPVPMARLISELPLAASTAYTLPIAIRIGTNGEDSSMSTAIQLPVFKPQRSDPSQRNRVPQEKKQEPPKHKLFVRLLRGPGADQPVIIRGFHLPKGVSLSELTIQGDQTEGELEMTIEDSVTLANFELIIIGETKLQANQPQSDESQRRQSQTEKEKVLNVQLWSLPRTIELIPHEGSQPNSQP